MKSSIFREGNAFMLNGNIATIRTASGNAATYTYYPQKKEKGTPPMREGIITGPIDPYPINKAVFDLLRKTILKPWKNDRDTFIFKGKGTQYSVIYHGGIGFHAVGVHCIPDKGHTYFVWNIKYLHEFQNIYQLLTGLELTINKI